MSFLRFVAMTVCTCVIVFLFTTFVYAQSDYGSITGFVKDPSGAVVPNRKSQSRTRERRRTVLHDQ